MISFKEEKMPGNRFSKIVSLLLILGHLLWLVGAPAPLFAYTVRDHLRAQSAAGDGGTKDALSEEMQEEHPSSRRDFLRFLIGTALVRPAALLTAASGVSLTCSSCGKDAVELPTTPPPAGGIEIQPGDIRYTKEQANTLALGFLEGQVQPSGLVKSFKTAGDRRSFLYNNGQVLTYFSNTGKTAEARPIADALVSLQNEDGSWFFRYDLDGHPFQREKLTGSIAVAGRGMADIYGQVGEAEYLQAARDAADFILGFQKTDPASPLFGSISGGLTNSGVTLPWTRTEHNARGLMFLYRLWKVDPDPSRRTLYAERARWVGDWLTQKAWNGRSFKARFDEGGNVDATETWKTDAQYLPMIAFALSRELLQIDPGFYNSIPWLLSFVTTVTYNGRLLHGFSVQTERDRSSFWSEAAVGVGVVALLLGDQATADRFLLPLRFIQKEDGGIPSIIGARPAEGYPHHFAEEGVDSTLDFLTILNERPLVYPVVTPPTEARDGAGRISMSQEAALSPVQSYNPSASVLHPLLRGNPPFLQLELTSSLLQADAALTELRIVAELLDRRGVSDAVVLVDPTPEKTEPHEPFLRVLGSRYGSVAFLTPQEIATRSPNRQGSPIIRMGLEGEEGVFGGNVDYTLTLPAPDTFISFFSLLQVALLHRPDVLKAFPEERVRQVSGELTPQLSALSLEEIQSLVHRATTHLTTLRTSLFYQRDLEFLLKAL